MNILEACPACLSGAHSICSVPQTPEMLYCCCNGMATLEGFVRALYGSDDETPSRPAKTTLALVAPVETKTVGRSGYIAPEAWASPSNIGELTDPRSTGRKRADRMYPITPGQVCEWANLKNVGFGPVNIVGCMGNPASDIHHGPDKNTLNNSKMSRGVGFGENVHLICSPCHNKWHALNNQFYPDYDRVEDQTKPWLPVTDFDWADRTVPIPASFDELTAEEKARREDLERRGKDVNDAGRNSKPRDAGNTDIADD